MVEGSEKTGSAGIGINPCFHPADPSVDIVNDKRANLQLGSGG